jgi:hypothetical protein
VAGRRRPLCSGKDAMSHLSRRLGALVAASALTLAGLTLLAGPAHAVNSDDRPMTVGADWLAGQLTNGLMHNPNFGGFDDYGLSIDAGLALDAVGGHASNVQAISTALAGAIGSYVTGEDFGDAGSSYAGATAKAAVFARIAGDDPTAYGGLDLVTRLEARVATSAPITGRIEDLSSFGDFANTIGQAFAVNALDAASSTKAADALSFLLEQQCSAGYFRLYMTDDKTAPDQTCEGGRASGDSAPDPDATSTAVRLLLPQIDTSPAVARAVGKAEAWLLGRQNADGSFGGGTSTSGANANSTGLAAWALGALGDSGAATAAAVWVRQHQADELASCPNALSTETGAIAYDDAGVASGRASGITDANSDQWRRATSQALPALVYAPAGTQDLTLAGPTGYVKAGTTVTYHVHGAVPGDKVCITGVGAASRAAAGADGAVAVPVTLPAGTANRTAVVSGRQPGTASVLTKVLGAKRLTVTPARFTKHRGTRLHVVVNGLAPGEQVRLRFRGVTVRSGLADPSGRFARYIRVGQKLGKARIVAWGEFPAIRHGRAVIHVVP